MDPMIQNRMESTVKQLKFVAGIFLSGRPLYHNRVMYWWVFFKVIRV